MMYDLVIRRNASRHHGPLAQPQSNFFPCIPFQYNTFHYASRKADAEQHFLYVHGDSVGLLQRVLGMRDVVQKLQLL